MKKQKRPDPYLTDEDSPELTEEWFAKARPFRQFFDEDCGPGKADEFLAAIENLRRQQQTETQTIPAKARVTLRVDADVLAAFRQTGPGWQARMNEILRQAVPH
jgi:uncharacterized protein (DUF4415 family)